VASPYSLKETLMFYFLKTAVYPDGIRSHDPSSPSSKLQSPRWQVADMICIYHYSDIHPIFSLYWGCLGRWIFKKKKRIEKDEMFS
jgi:hypothetical protein